MRLSQFKQIKNVELVVDINSLEEYRLFESLCKEWIVCPLLRTASRAPSNKSIRLCRDKRSFLDDKGYWNVYPVAFNPAQVFVVCPHCGEIHLHGRGQEPEFKYEGHRVCQCLVGNNNGYIIKRGKHA